MVSALLLIAKVNCGVDFPDAPLASELRQGARTFAQKKGIERVYQDDRVAFGLWFDGKIKRDTDQILWLSPNLISRCLGYLGEYFTWTNTEMQDRWNITRELLGGKLTFVVDLYHLPKQSDVLELTDGANLIPADCFELDAALTVPAGNEEKNIRQTIDGRIVKVIRGIVVGPILTRAPRFEKIRASGWPSLYPEYRLLSIEPVMRRPSVFAAVGEMKRATFLVKFPMPEPKVSEFEVTLNFEGKQVKVRFPRNRPTE